MECNITYLLETAKHCSLAWIKLIRERFGKKVCKKKRCSYIKGLNKVGENQIKLDPRSYCKIKWTMAALHSYQVWILCKANISQTKCGKTGSFVYFLKNEALYAARLLRTPPKRKISIDQGGQVIETNPIAANEQLQPAKKTPRTVQLVTVSRKQSVPKKVTTKKNSSRNLRLCRRFGSDRKPQLLIIRDRFFSVGCKFYSNKNYG